MIINEILSANYNQLLSLCRKNTISTIQQQSGLNDNEDNDLLNSLCIRWLKKYKDQNITNSNELIKQLTTEFLTEKNHFQKMAKPDTFFICPLDYAAGAADPDSE